MVRVLYFGESQDYAGTNEHMIDLMDVPTQGKDVTLHQLISFIMSSKPEFYEYYLKRYGFIALALNQEYITIEQPANIENLKDDTIMILNNFLFQNFSSINLKDCDEVAFIPPVSGG